MSYFIKEEAMNRSENIKIREIPHLLSAGKISQLNFSHNQIRSIPMHITSAVNLQIIDLSHNRIGKIQFLCGIRSLKFINLSHNLISEVPEDVIQLVDIQNLDLGFNKITILNNIKVLKQLVQMRMIKYHGFIEINLEGNQVLKKKGCREIYHKWMNPKVQNFNKMMNKAVLDNPINRTKKRQTQSVDLNVRMKEQNQFIHTNKTLQLVHNSHQLNKSKDQLNKSKDQVNTSQNLTDKSRLSPNCIPSDRRQLSYTQQMMGIIPAQSEILKGTANIKDLSGIFPEDREHINNISEWFTATLQKLKELGNIFTLIITNEDVKNLQNDLKQRIIEQSLYAKELVNISSDIVSQNIQNNYSKEGEQRFKQQQVLICEKIKEMHQCTLKLFNEKDYLPVKLYKPWVTYFRQLKQISSNISHKIAIHQSKQMREQQIKDLVDISPDKKDNLITIRQNTKQNQSGTKNRSSRLDDLLFSNRDEFLLMSDGKRSNSERKLSVKEDNDCESCLMMKWENDKVRQQLKQALQRIVKLQGQKTEYQRQIKVLSEVKQKYNKLQQKQDLIIDQLEQIQPSTYQNILLEQAKAMEYMIGQEPFNLNSHYTADKVNPKHSVSIKGGNQKEMTNTHIASAKMKNNHIQNTKNVSEFTVYGSQELATNTGRSSSYFKNKNAVTTINRTGEDSKNKSQHQMLTTEENKLKSSEKRKRNQVIVSQFNSEVNSFPDSSEKKKSQKNDKEKDHSVKARSSFASNHSKGKSKGNSNQSKNKKILRQVSEKTQNDVFLISQQSMSQNLIQNSFSHHKFEDKSLTKRNHQEHLKSEEYDKVLQGKLLTQRQKISSKKSQNYDKFGGKIELRGRSSLTQKRQSKGWIDHENNKQNINPQKIKRAKTKQALEQICLTKYEDHGYVPMKSQEGDSYRRYMQYHLRNNIIDILTKKSGNNLGDAINRDKKYIYMTKSQKLINKRPESAMESKQREKYRVQEVNKTLR